MRGSKFQNFKIFLLIFINICSVSSQNILNPNQNKKLLLEYDSVNNKADIKNKRLNLVFNQLFFINSNLPNFENINGTYLHKGYGGLTSFIFTYENENFFISAEPRINLEKRYHLDMSTKTKSFSVLNDVSLGSRYNNQNIKNLGIKFKINRNLYLAYGNWSHWWGPGIHNSLTLSNNAKSFYHFYLKINNFNEIDHKIKYNFKYIVSNSILNNLGSKFYFSGLFFSIKYNSLELGLSKIILSGGYPDLVWTSNEASFVLFTNRKIKYWDKTNDVYLKYTSNNSKFITFIQLGLPNSLFSVRELDIFSRKNIGSIMGLRKYDAFEINGLIFGIEYTRLLQGKFFDISPTPNWYQNAKYDFSSFEGRRWAAHSGTDSDDLLVYSGIIGKKKNIIIGLNYERHGVTYKFPPEVKFELRINMGLRLKNLYVSIDYENELYENHSFINGSNNLWTEIFEPGSFQRTNSLMFNIEKTIIN